MGPSKVTQTNQQILSPEQKQLLNMGMSGASDALNSPNATMPGTQPFDPLQVIAQNQTVANASAGGSIANAANDIGNTSHFLSGDVLKAESNPYLSGAIDAAVRPINEAFTNTVLPGLRTNAISAGGLGNTRNDIATGIATRGLMRQVADTSSSMSNTNYQAGLDAMVKNQALAPTSMQAQLFPQAALDAVGSQRRDLATQTGTEGFAQNNLDFTRALQLLQASGGVPGGGTTGSVTPATGGGGIQGLLSQGLGAASLLATVLPMFSDRRLKEDARIVGKAANGLNIWRYRINGKWQTGFMADEVEQVNPGAVGEIAGYKVVDYARAAA